MSCPTLLTPDPMDGVDASHRGPINPRGARHALTHPTIGYETTPARLGISVPATRTLGCIVRTSDRLTDGERSSRTLAVRAAVVSVFVDAAARRRSRPGPPRIEPS